MSFSIKGVKVRLSFWFVALLAVLSLYDVSGTMLAGLFAALLHESGHLLCILAVGSRPEELKLEPFGCQMSCKAVFTRRQAAAIALSGAAANFIAAGVSAFSSLLLTEPPYPLIAANICLGAINLLPVAPLDGAQLLELILSRRIPAAKLERLLTAISFSFAVPALAFGIYVLLVSRYNFSLLFLALWLLACCLKRVLID